MGVFRTVVTASALALVSIAAHAVTVHLTGDLKASAEVPPKDSPGAGPVTATLDMRFSCQTIEDSSLRKNFIRRESTFRQVVGNLRFPLTVTYHGCPPGSQREWGVGFRRGTHCGAYDPCAPRMAVNGKLDFCQNDSFTSSHHVVYQ